MDLKSSSSSALAVEKMYHTSMVQEVDDDELSLNMQMSSNPTPNKESPLLQLPIELLHSVLSYLSAQNLARLSATCRCLAEHTANDLLWANIVNSYLPEKVHDPGPFGSFRSLYIAYHPCWFIPQKKIWFSDTEHTGNLILARYDPRRGVIEAYRVIAERRSPSHKFQIWEWNPDVIIQTFHPKPRLWLDSPILLLRNHDGGREYLGGEIRMPLPLESQQVFNSLSFCPKEPPLDPDPYKQWPPPIVPSRNRVYRSPETHSADWERNPGLLELMSEDAFRIRRWAHFRLGMPMFAAGRSETLSTYATLDPHLYTPTWQKPYQGIWIGDYSAHGCEFLLFLQRDSEDGPGEAAEESEFLHDGIIQKGSLEAIKLTGDPNVPRGELSFISDDIGPKGFVRVADESLFRGAKIVRSRGHVAGLGFRDDTFIASQLILISPDCVAHYWETMGHISYFRRLNLDELTQI
ncbi:F-box domain protein [Aspergillus bertholletiae]|uniref:F-box domain protein n=1 Tax=Aspergillus bertholletiae TaxID=1226010 RepID=A0A5N7BB03_9EURO|nr:F-box domain protein [Aspergillus bertholletiae]